MADRTSLDRVPGESLGAMLRRHRERRRMSLAEVSRVTRIPSSTLLALESDRLDQLPGEVFVRGFLRSYAQSVGLPPNDVVSMYVASSASSDRDVGPVLVSAPVESSREGQGRRFGVLLALIVLMLLVALALSIVLKPRGRDMPVELSRVVAHHGRLARG